ncbi:MAG: nuclear transport factor 2 family protein [Steroidobacteraceae bacterium]
MNSDKIADRLEIEDVVTQSCVTVDQRNWKAYLDCFTADAQIDYTHRTSIVSPAEFAKRSSGIVEKFSATQHFAMNSVVKVDGDAATSQVYILAQHGGGAPDGRPRFIAGAIYSDQLERTTAGWRIRHRRADVVWAEGDTEHVWAKSTSVS